jgi:hypothetical protein
MHTPVRHGVLGVHGEVEDCDVELGDVDLDRPQVPRDREPDRDAFVQRMVEQAGQLVDVLTELQDLGLEGIVPRERQELTGNACTAIERIANACRKLVAPFGILCSLHQLEPA